MALADDMIEAINAEASARYAADPASAAPAMVALGPAGEKVRIAGQMLDTGQALATDKTLRVLVTGIAASLASSQAQTAAIVGKLNELIAAYNQLRTDYDSSTVPTTAPAVTPLPT